MKSRFLLSLIMALAMSLATMASELGGRVKVIRAPLSGSVIKAQTDAKGTIHLLIDAEDGPRYVNSQDGGATFNTPLPIVDAATQKPGLKFSGWDLVVGKGGQVHVAMGNNAWKLKLPKEEWAFYYATLSPGAKAFSPVRNLNRQPSEGFSLAANERGDITACFLSGKLYVMVSHDNGQTFSAVSELNPAWNPCDCCTSAAAYGPDRKAAILYREETNNDRDMYVALWDQSSEDQRVKKRVSQTPWPINACPMTYFSINRTETGYVAAWPTKGQIYFARLDKDGALLPPGEVRTPGMAGMRTGVTALSASDGTTLIVWKNQTKDSLRWQVYDAKGKPEGELGTAKSIGSGAAAVALNDGKFAVFP
jgi:hypothetical protein